MSTKRILVALVGLTVVSAVAAPVSAQSGASPRSAEERRPFRGIFGAPASPESPHSLVFTGSVYGAYDDNVTEAITEGSVSSPWLQKSGGYQGANAGLDYGFSLEGERVDFRGRAGAQMQYFWHEDRSGSRPSSQADLTFNARLTQSLTFNVRQAAAYASNYNAAVTPRIEDGPGLDIGLPDDPALDLFELRAVQFGTTVGLAQRVGRYASFSGGYQVRSTRLVRSEVPDSGFHDYTTQAGTAGFRYARPLTRAATLVLGYGIRVSDGRSRTGEPEVMHNVNVGVDYGRALSFSRRTSLRFGTGSAIAVSESVNTPGQRKAQARLTGDVSLLHELGRTWTASLAYTRGFRTRDGFNQLYFTDAVTARIGGLVTRRLSLSANGTWADSSIGEGSSRNHRGQSATAQASFALSRLFALYTQYVYYHYRFDQTVPLDNRFPRQLDRHGVRAGLTTSVPLIR